MNNRNVQAWQKFFVVCLVCIFCAGSLSGCASLKKKFTRQKKNVDGKEDFIPVLEPVEYPSAESSPMNVYKNHYAMTKAYFKDLSGAFDQREGSDKGEKYIFTELTSHLQSMGDLLSPSKKAEAAALIGQIQDVLKEYDKPRTLRRYDIIRIRMRGVERDVRKTLKPDVVSTDIGS